MFRTKDHQIISNDWNSGSCYQLSPVIAIKLCLSGYSDAAGTFGTLKVSWIYS